VTKSKPVLRRFVTQDFSTISVMVLWGGKNDRFCQGSFYEFCHWRIPATQRFVLQSLCSASRGEERDGGMGKTMRPCSHGEGYEVVDGLIRD
jgi:hypothetical protein